MISNPKLSTGFKGQICKRCILDESVPRIEFDTDGICNYCKNHDLLLNVYKPKKETLEKQKNDLIAAIKTTGRGRKYDCIAGVSGGTDSTYVLYLAKKLGLKPLAVHLDDGWNSEIAVSNIKKATAKLGFDLETYVLNWEEIRSLHRAFFKASVPDPGVPSDVAIHGALYKVAQQEGIKYILGGQSFTTEGTQPREWSYIDGTYVKSLHRLFGEVPLETFPNATIYQIAYFIFVKRIKQIPFLNFFSYDKAETQILLKKELDWEYYGEHHYESIYSQFINAFYNIKKFGIDRRKVTYSGPVRMGIMKREDAMEKILTPPEISQETIDYCIQKLGFSKNEFKGILREEPRSFLDYKTSYRVLNRFRIFVKKAADWNIISPIIYHKYLG